MKTRNGFVTNSSSSNFIIAAKDIRLEELFFGPFKEFFYERYNEWGIKEEEIDEMFDLKKVINNEDISLAIHIMNGEDATKFNYDEIKGSNECYFEHGFLKNDTLPKDEIFYVISNNDNGRFNLTSIDIIFREKYGIPYMQGYCD